jgi:hypothetical protein
MGIWDDIKNTQAVKAGTLTKNDLYDFMTTLEHNANQAKHTWVGVTGVGGMRMMQNAMQTQVYLKLMGQLNFSREERKRLGKMINSPDPENFEIAKILIDNKKKEAEEYHK